MFLLNAPSLASKVGAWAVTTGQTVVHFKRWTLVGAKTNNWPVESVQVGWYYQDLCTQNHAERQQGGYPHRFLLKTIPNHLQFDGGSVAQWKNA